MKDFLILLAAWIFAVVTIVMAVTGYWEKDGLEIQQAVSGYVDALFDSAEDGAE